MGKFSKAGGREMPELNTSSLPDLVFAFLFFIMMVTSMREVTLKVEFHAPQATELQKLEKKSLVTFIYVGKPTRDLRAKMGSETRIQLNDAFAETSEIQDYIAQEKSSMKEEDQPFTGWSGISPTPSTLAICWLPLIPGSAVTVLSEP